MRGPYSPYTKIMLGPYEFTRGRRQCVFSFYPSANMHDFPLPLTGFVDCCSCIKYTYMTPTCTSNCHNNEPLPKITNILYCFTYPFGDLASNSLDNLLKITHYSTYYTDILPLNESKYLDPTPRQKKKNQMK